MEAKKFNDVSVDEAISATETLMKYTSGIAQELESDEDDKSEGIAASLFVNFLLMGVLCNLDTVRKLSTKIIKENEHSIDKQVKSTEEVKDIPSINLSDFVKAGVKS